MYLLDDGEQYWIAATSAEEAMEKGRNDWLIGDGLDEGEEVTCQELDDADPIDITMTDHEPGDPLPEGDDVKWLDEQDGEPIVVRASAATWAKWVGRGNVVCSSIFA